MGAAEELLKLNQRLLEAIGGADWDTYAELCDPSLSAFEPEACGQLIEGLEFHRFYFQLGAASRARNTTMCGAKVRMLGDDAAVVSYVRINQRVKPDGAPTESAHEETRIWQRTAGKWRHVHFHRSPLRLTP